MGDAVIVPRWEWRTFGTRFGARTYLAALTPTGVQESDETYLLSSEGDTVKVRDGLMDIKVLREVDGFGLERWEPVMKADAPLTADEIAAVFQALRQPLPSPLPDATTFEAFLAEHIERSGAFGGPSSQAARPLRDRGLRGRAVRRRGGRSAHSNHRHRVADPRAVRSAVRVVGLGGTSQLPPGAQGIGRPAACPLRDNRRGHQLGEVPHRGADIGGGWRAVVDRANVTQLGEGLAATGAISSNLARTTSAIAAMIDEATRLGARAIAAVGTAGPDRGQPERCRGGDRARHGCLRRGHLREEESRLAYLAVRAGLQDAGGTLACSTPAAELAVHVRNRRPCRRTV